jgi:hypothetical protein
MVSKVDLKDPKQSHSLANRYELDNIDMALLRHLSKFPDTPHAHLAKLVGIQRGAVSKRMKKEAFKRAWDEVLADTKDIMQKNARLAAKRLTQLIQSDDKTVAINAIKIALTPWMQQYMAQNQDSGSSVKVYETTVAVDGTLVQKVIELEAERDAKKNLVGDHPVIDI